MYVRFGQARLGFELIEPGLLADDLVFLLGDFLGRNKGIFHERPAVLQVAVLCFIKIVGFGYLAGQIGLLQREFGMLKAVPFGFRREDFMFQFDDVAR